MSADAAATSSLSGGRSTPADATPYSSEPAKRFASYWFALPRTGVLPARSAFNPADIKDLLPIVVLRDVDELGNSRYRLVGTGIRDLLGEELTGLNPIHFVPSGDADRYRQATHVMLSRPCGLVTELHFTSDGGQRLTIENVSMPFAPGEDGTRQTLSIFSTLPHDHVYIEGKLKMSDVGPINFIDVGNGAPPPM